MISLYLFDKISFNNATTCFDQLANIAEDYFYLDGMFGYRHYEAISTSCIATVKNQNSMTRTLVNVIKFFSYFTLIIPLFMLAVKLIERRQYSFKILSNVPAPSAPKSTHVEHVRNLRNNPNFVPDAKECRAKQFRAETAAWHVMEKLPEVQARLEERKKTHGDARDFFSTLLLMSDLDRVKFRNANIFGKGVSAHGVEADKGGIHNLLNIMLEGLIFSPWYGLLDDGMPDYSAGPHGPYYVILDTKQMDEDKKSSPRAQANMIEEKYHKHYLVPDNRHREFLMNALTKAVEIGMLTPVEKVRIQAKILTYAQF